MKIASDRTMTPIFNLHFSIFNFQFRAGWFVPAALLATYGVIAGTALTRDSLTFDELGHLTGGFSSWVERDHRLFQQNGQLPKRWATLPLIVGDVRLPSTGQQAWWDSDLDDFGHQFLYETGNDLERMLLLGRTMIVLTGALLGLVVFLWSNYLFGRIGGCISLALCVFSPALLAHARLATSDLIAALTFIVALLCLWEVLHRITIARVLCCAVATGLLLVSKMSGLLIVPIAVVLAGLRLAGGLSLYVELPRHARVIRGTTRQLVYLSAVALVVSAGAVFVAWAFYDFRYSAFREYAEGRDRFYRDESIDGMTEDLALGPAIRLARDLKLFPESYLFGLSHILSHSRAHPAFMNGHYSRSGWGMFFPYAALVKTPLPVFAVAALAVWAAVWPMERRARSGHPIGRRVRRSFLRAYRTAPLWVFLALYWAVALRVHLSIGERHVLPTYPAAFILCGVAGRWIQKQHRLCSAMLLAALGWLAVETVRISPCYLSYFNQLAGGPENGYRHLVDSSLDWGQDLSQLRKWLERRREATEETGPVYLAYFGSGDPAFSGIESKMLPCYLDWRKEIDRQPLQPGTYVISATMLQSVYGLAFGPWNGDYEQIYRRYRKRLAGSEADRVALKRIREGRSSDEERMIYEFDQLRFARLCAHLRRREPNDRVAYSILVYYVSNDELQTALGPDE